MSAGAPGDPTARWFERTGMPLADEEREAIAAIHAWHGFPAAAEIVGIGSWSEALSLLEMEARESRLWDAHEGERERLWELGMDRHTEDELLAALRAAELATSAALAEGGTRAAARLGVQDARFAAEAIGAARLAVHHAALARLAAAGERHPFHGTLALFASGRWPLGLFGGRFVVF